jgi:hypothetical protein
MGAFLVKCKKSFKQFEGILDEGDTILIEPKYTTEDQVIDYRWETEMIGNKEVRTRIPNLIQPKGSYDGFHFKLKNGKYYDDKWIGGCIGPKPMSEIFEKL